MNLSLEQGLILTSNWASKGLSYSCCIETEINFRVSVFERGLYLPFDAYVLHIVKANDLAKADMLGKSDPFVVIEYNNEEIGRTITINDTMDPKWKDETFVIDMQKAKLEIIPELPFDATIQEMETSEDGDSRHASATSPKSPSVEPRIGSRWRATKVASSSKYLTKTSQACSGIF